MTLWADLLESLEASGASHMTILRAGAAVKTLGAVFGTGFVLPNVDADFAQIVEVPGDPNRWVVFGTWEDGTFDIIQEGGLHNDVMVGWVPGQSRADYFKELEDETDVGGEEGNDGGGEAGSAGARGALSVVPGGRLRGSGGGSGTRRKAGDHPRDIPATTRRRSAGGVPASCSKQARREKLQDHNRSGKDKD